MRASKNMAWIGFLRKVESKVESVEGRKLSGKVDEEQSALRA